MNDFGGLLVGNVIKYAGSTQKDISIGLSIVFSSCASVVLFDFEINQLFVVGVAIAMFSVLLCGEKVGCCGLFEEPQNVLPTQAESKCGGR